MPELNKQIQQLIENGSTAFMCSECGEPLTDDEHKASRYQDPHCYISCGGSLCKILLEEMPKLDKEILKRKML